MNASKITYVWSAEVTAAQVATCKQCRDMYTCVCIRRELAVFNIEETSPPVETRWCLCDDHQAATGVNG